MNKAKEFLSMTEMSDDEMIAKATKAAEKASIKIGSDIDPEITPMGVTFYNRKGKEVATWDSSSGKVTKG